MRRRDFILAFGSVALWPIAVRAQQTGKLPIIGFFGSGTPSSQKRVTDAFLQRLRELGWADGRNVTVAYRWAEGRNERYGEIAAEFERMKPDLIVASGSASVSSAKQASSVIPIVFTIVNDPVGSGVVASLARPGGNITGLSLQNPELAGKRLGLAREIMPGIRRLAIMANANNPGAALELSETVATARATGLDATRLEIRRKEDITAALDTIKGRVEALYVCSDAFVVANRVLISDLALAARLPTVHALREYAEAGGLMSYGADNADLFRRSADYVDKILRGAKPGDLPVEQPTKFELIVNLKTAKALGLTIPEAFLLRADEVIE